MKTWRISYKSGVEFIFSFIFNISLSQKRGANFMQLGTVHAPREKFENHPH